jgi:hypothetical protein
VRSGALASTGVQAADFYGRILDRDPVMVLPGGVVLDSRPVMVESMSGQPWSSYQLEDMRELRPTDDVGVVTYGVTACRSGSDDYSALMSSMYVLRDDGWKLAFHQQSPR